MVAVSNGASHTCALQDQGSVLCWGNKSNGLGTTKSIEGSFTAVSSGVYQTCGLRHDDSVYCWAWN